MQKVHFFLPSAEWFIPEYYILPSYLNVVVAAVVIVLLKTLNHNEPTTILLNLKKGSSRNPFFC